VTRFKEAGEETPSVTSPVTSPYSAPSTGMPPTIHHSGLATLSTGSRSSFSRRFSDHEEHLYFWMPLLIGLTELTFDPRKAVRISALEMLFDILNEHGSCYSEGFWDKVFARMLLPIFDSVQVEDIDFATFSASVSEEASRDRWLYETCSHCLHHLIDLVVKFYPLVQHQLPKVLLKIQAFMLRTHHSLACVGVTAMERLISRSGPQMSEDMWNEVMAGLLHVAEATKPDIRKLMQFPPERYFRGDVPEDGAHLLVVFMGTVTVMVALKSVEVQSAAEIHRMKQTVQWCSSMRPRQWHACPLPNIPRLFFGCGTRQRRIWTLRRPLMPALHTL
jgi:hypothetical protein